MKKAFLFKITLLFGTMFSGILLLLLLFVVCMDGGASPACTSRQMMRQRQLIRPSVLKRVCPGI